MWRFSGVSHILSTKIYTVTHQIDRAPHFCTWYVPTKDASECHLSSFSFFPFCQAKPHMRWIFHVQSAQKKCEIWSYRRQHTGSKVYLPSKPFMIFDTHMVFAPFTSGWLICSEECHIIMWCAWKIREKCLTMAVIVYITAIIRLYAVQAVWRHWRTCVEGGGDTSSAFLAN